MDTRINETTPEISAIAEQIIAKRYLSVDEDGVPENGISDVIRRVAKNVSQAELEYDQDETVRQFWEEAFYSVMAEMDFLPNSPTLMNAGTDIQQLSACFVLPIEDSMESIFETVKNTALIHKSGGGTGFSFSRIRPRNDTVNSTRGISSGPVSFMNVFDAATETVKQGGRRRGANMAMLRVDHPDIIEFISAKADTTRLNNFNISVAITDAFMRALELDGNYDLVNPRTAESCGSLNASEVFEQIVDHAWKTGEPGVVFIDRINHQNPTPWLGEMEGTNPCGEQPLLPYESCNLGSINLSHFVNGEPGECSVDVDRLRETVDTCVRFLDNVIDMNNYPVTEIAETTRRNRKIGLGVMGFAELLVLLGVEYDSDEAVVIAEDVMAIIQDASHKASHALAIERGTFPSSLKESNGSARRNATLTTIAPTGSISIIAGTSSGVEPIFALAYKRRAVDDSFLEVNPLFDRIARKEGFFTEELIEDIAGGASVQDCETVPQRWRRLFKTAHDISPEAHVRIQAAFQKHTDNAVSKTVNFPSSATKEDVKRVFCLAYESGCKGATIYRDGSRDAQVLSTGATTSTVKAGDVLKTPRARPSVVTGATRKVETGCGNLYVTVNHDESGPFEVFAQCGKTGGCAASQTEAIGRLTSLALRSGVAPKAVAAQLRGVRCPSPAWNKGNKVYSCADGIGQAIQRCLDGVDEESVLPPLATGSFKDVHAGSCPDCSGTLEFEGGCAVCRGCGYSRC